jgi:hypothetical protein
MDLLERAIFLAIGGGIGFILGYIVARLRDIKEEVDEVLMIEKEKHGMPTRRKKDEDGFMRIPVIADVAYLLALTLILLGLWGMNNIADDLQESTSCNTEYLKSQAEFLSVILAEPPETAANERAALQEYYDLLTAYADSSTTPTEAELDRYNISDEFKACLINEGE